MQIEHPQVRLQATAKLLQALGGTKVVALGPLPNSVTDGFPRGTHWLDLPAVTIDSAGSRSSGLHAPTEYICEQSCIHQHKVEPLEYLEHRTQPIDLLIQNAWEIGSPNYKALHLQAFELARPWLHAKSLVLINGTDLEHGGKGEQVIPAAEAAGYQLLFSDQQTLLVGPGVVGIQDRLAELGVRPFSSLTFDDAVQLQRRGLTWQAERIYLAVLERDPRHVGALHLLGLTYQQRGLHELALQWIGKAIALDARNAVFFNNYGAAHLALNHTIEALGCFAAAIAIRPAYADAQSNLGHAWDLVGNTREAEKCFRAALTHDPQHRDTFGRFSQVLSRQGRRLEAIQILQQAVQAHEAPEFYSELGNCFLLDGQAEKAAEAYARSLALQPQQPVVHYNLGNALAELDDISRARQALRTACTGAKHQPTWPLREMLLCPTVFSTSEEIDAFREQLSTQLDELLANPPAVRIQDLVNIGFYPPFALSFQGREHRPLKEKFAAVFRQWIRPVNAEPRVGKPRIGFVVTRGHEGLFLRCCAAILNGLDRQQLEIVICCPKCSEARLRQGLQTAKTEFVVFQEDVASAVEAIARAGCHLLYHWEIGTDALNYVLPFYRLAPVQVTAWGTQVTSGIAEVDYYLSSQLIEAENAQEHYTERLHLFQTLPTCMPRLPPVAPVTRDYFGLPDDRPLYLCPQTVLKLHPEQDALFAEVLDKDSRGVLVIKEGRHQRANDVLKARLQRALGPLQQRVIFIPWQPKEDYLRLLTQADVILDTHYFSAGSTTYDLFSYDLPIVTLPGRWNISRYTLACYRKMGIMDLVAQAPIEYAQLAVRLANDRDWRGGILKSLQTRTPCLFDDQGSITEHQAFFMEKSRGCTST